MNLRLLAIGGTIKANAVRGRPWRRFHTSTAAVLVFAVVAIGIVAGFG